MRPLEPVDTADLFPPLHAALIGLLQGLISIEGDPSLAEPLLATRSVME